jgi:DNA polymerase III epsilon subunit-like protein
MYLIAYDTETTGIFRPNLELTNPGQPHLVSVSALQVQPGTYRVNQSISLLVKPNGCDIPDEAIAVHGITTSKARAEGQDEKHVLTQLLHLWADPANLRIAHNAEFDKNIIASAIARYYGAGELLKAWLAGSDFCTMKESKSIVNAQTKPNAQGKTRLKNPRLDETFFHFFHETFDNQHSANADAVAVLNIFRALEADIPF